MDNGSGYLNSAVAAPFSPKPAPPRLVLEFEPAHRVFLRNLADTLLPRRAPPLEISSPPASFWPDVFVSSRMPWVQFVESAMVHVLVLAGMWGVGRALALRPQITPRAAFHKEDVIYYSPSEYLRPIDTGESEVSKTQRGEPEYAKQPIISVPREADNHSQTIVTPPNIKLEHDVALPNVVAWNSPAPAPPLPNAGPPRVLDSAPSIVAPPPDVTQAIERRIDSPGMAVVAPAPAITAVGARNLPVSTAGVIAPPPNMPQDVRLGDMNIGSAEVVAPAPQLPVRAQRTLGGITSLAGQQTKIIPPPPSLNGASGQETGRGAGIAGNASVIPPAPSLHGVAGRSGNPGIKDTQAGVVGPPPAVNGGTSSSGRQLIALSLHPAVGAPPAEVAGNRRGSFSATPEGKPGAPGTPASHSAGGRGNGNGGSANSGHDTGLPAGIHVGAGPQTGGTSQAADGNGAGTGASSAKSADKTLVADNRPMRVTVAPQRALDSPNAPSALERQVFGDRKSYGMMINMPNLNSGGGSWVIRFAELKESVAAAQGNLIAPEATHKVDPGYPMELMRQNVKGTVTLYAVIHSDGHVSDVKVLESPDDRLDQFARSAVERWEFRPAMRNGVPVALEAVIKIPFRPGRVF